MLSNLPIARQSAPVTAPLDFLKIFSAQMRGAGIEFAITSGMACVHYGLQQTTKDSDWIIPHEDLEKLRALFVRLEGDLPTWRVSYRQICGAPLDAEWMQHGWTSHLSIWDSAGSVEHKVDIFSKPPRVKPEEMSVDPDGWVSRHVVAQMKKTDRDKDWPIVDGLGRSLWGRRIETGLLHIMALAELRAAWNEADASARDRMATRRPLLRLLAQEPVVPDAELRLMIALERMIWERVNEQRHSRFTRTWRNFYRNWRREENWQWPTEEPFDRQHVRLTEAAHRHGLPANPAAGFPAEQLVQAAVHDLLSGRRFTEKDIASVLPPVTELLP